MTLKKNSINRFFSIAMWMLLGFGSVVLLVAAVRNNNGRRCSGMKVAIKGRDQLYINESEIRKVVSQYSGADIKGRLITDFDLHAIETSLKKDIWVSNAKLFFDNNEVFRVSVVQREPVARIFTHSGYSFYVDSALAILPLSNLTSARLPVFTGFPADHKVLRKRDSLLLRDIRDISILIQQDPVLMAMVDQVDVTRSYEFEMIPKIGSHIICFGDASAADEKFENLRIFYREVLAKGRMNRYDKISLKFSGQVVATLKGHGNEGSDSVQILRMMSAIAEESERKANDTTSRIVHDNTRFNTDVSIIQQNFERDESPDAASVSPKESTTRASVLSTAPAKAVSAPTAKPVVVSKPAASANAKENKVNNNSNNPKAIMPPKKNLKTKN